MGSGVSSKPEMGCEEARPASVMEQLRHRRDKAIAEVKQFEETIALFEAHPEFEQCLSQLARCGIYR